MNAKLKKLAIATAATTALTIPMVTSLATGTAQAATGNGKAFVGNSSQSYYMVTFLSGIEFWKGVYAGMEAAGKDLGVNTVFTGGPQYNINQEVTVMQQVIAKKPAGIIVTSINAQAMTPVINQAIKAGIPVISFDSDAPDSQRYGYIGTSNTGAGKTAADYLGSQLKGKGQVAVVSNPGQLNLDQRVQGFETEMAAKYPHVKVVAVENGNSNQLTAAQVTGPLLQRYPNLGGIFAVDAEDGSGVATAVHEAGRTGKTKIVSFDTDKATLEDVKNGQITATIAQGVWNEGYWALMEAYAVHNSIPHPVANWKTAQVNPIPVNVDTGVTVVTKANVNAYLN